VVTLVVILVFACLIGAILASFGGWGPSRVLRRTTVVDRPVTERVVERPVTTERVVERPATERVVER